MNQQEDAVRAEEQAEILDGLCEWIKIESPSYDRDGVNRMMDIASSAMAELGASITRYPAVGEFRTRFGCCRQVIAGWIGFVGINGRFPPPSPPAD